MWEVSIFSLCLLTPWLRDGIGYHVADTAGGQNPLRTVSQEPPVPAAGVCLSSGHFSRVLVLGLQIASVAFQAEMLILTDFHLLDRSFNNAIKSLLLRLKGRSSTFPRGELGGEGNLEQIIGFLIASPTLNQGPSVTVVSTFSFISRDVILNELKLRLDDMERMGLMYLEDNPFYHFNTFYYFIIQYI